MRICPLATTLWSAKTGGLPRRARAGQLAALVVVVQRCCSAFGFRRHRDSVRCLAVRAAAAGAFAPAEPVRPDG